MRKLLWGLTALVILAIFAASLAQDGARRNLALLNEPNAKEAKQYVERKGYRILSYQGLVHRYTLTYEVLLSGWSGWSLQEQNPEPLIGRTIEVHGFTVKNHPLDHISDPTHKPTGRTEVNVFVSEGQVVGGVSFPELKTKFIVAGSPYALDGRTREEVHPMDYPAWGAKWRWRFENRELVGRPPFPDIRAAGHKLAVVRGHSCWNTPDNSYCSIPQYPPEYLRFAYPSPADQGSRLTITWARDPQELEVYRWIDALTRMEAPLDGKGDLTLPSEPGKHIYVVHAKWQEGFSEYMFEVELK